MEQDDAGFLERLRRRKVVQWGIAYVAAAWGLLQNSKLIRADAWSSGCIPRWAATTTARASAKAALKSVSAHVTPSSGSRR
jgi:hypothetical protein